MNTADLVPEFMYMLMGKASTKVIQGNVKFLANFFVLLWDVKHDNQRGINIKCTISRQVVVERTDQNLFFRGTWHLLYIGYV